VYSYRDNFGFVNMNKLRGALELALPFLLLFVGVSSSDFGAKNVVMVGLFIVLLQNVAFKYRLD